MHGKQRITAHTQSCFFLADQLVFCCKFTILFHSHKFVLIITDSSICSLSLHSFEIHCWDSEGDHQKVLRGEQNVMFYHIYIPYCPLFSLLRVHLYIQACLACYETLSHCGYGHELLWDSLSFKISVKKSYLHWKHCSQALFSERRHGQNIHECLLQYVKIYLNK